jgi:hypothetical protein
MDAALIKTVRIQPAWNFLAEKPVVIAYTRITALRCMDINRPTLIVISFRETSSN